MKMAIDLEQSQSSQQHPNTGNWENGELNRLNEILCSSGSLQNNERMILTFVGTLAINKYIRTGVKTYWRKKYRSISWAFRFSVKRKKKDIVKEKDDKRCVLLTRTRLSVLSPFVSNFTMYLMRILVCRHKSALMLSTRNITIPATMNKTTHTRHEREDKRYKKINQKCCWLCYPLNWT